MSRGLRQRSTAASLPTPYRHVPHCIPRFLILRCQLYSHAPRSSFPVHVVARVDTTAAATVSAWLFHSHVVASVTDSSSQQQQASHSVCHRPRCFSSFLHRFPCFPALLNKNRALARMQMHETNLQWRAQPSIGVTSTSNILSITGETQCSKSQDTAQANHVTESHKTHQFRRQS